MKHDFIDKYSTLASILHRLDPRIKLLITALFLILISATSNIRLFLFYGVVITLSILISKVPWKFFRGKLLLITPLAVLFAFFILLSFFFQHHIPLTWKTVFTYHPFYMTLATMILKIYMSILVISLLVSTTRFNDLLWSLRQFHMPKVVTTLSKLVYTYTFVFIDELHRTQRAYKSRTPVRRVSRVKVYGNIAGAILLRSIERSDIIYKAMVSRGFNGEFPEGNVHHLNMRDLWATVFFIAFTAITLIFWKI